MTVAVRYGASVLQKAPIQAVKIDADGVQLTTDKGHLFQAEFPGITAQFRQAKAVRDWTRTGRIQYGAKQVVGDRYCLLGQAAGAVLMVSGWFVGYGPRTLTSFSDSSASSSTQLDKTLVGLVNFLDHPTDFKFACGNQAGQVVDAVIEGDRLTIEVTYTGGVSLRNATLTGSLDEQGIFNGAFQMRLPNGLVSKEVRLSFDEDGSAQGVNKDWGNAIAILKI